MQKYGFLCFDFPFRAADWVANADLNSDSAMARGPEGKIWEWSEATSTFANLLVNTARHWWGGRESLQLVPASAGNHNLGQSLGLPSPLSSVTPPGCQHGVSIISCTALEKRLWWVRLHLLSRQLLKVSWGNSSFCMRANTSCQLGSKEVSTIFSPFFAKVIAHLLMHWFEPRCKEF